MAKSAKLRAHTAVGVSVTVCAIGLQRALHALRGMRASSESCDVQVLWLRVEALYACSGFMV